VLRIAIGGRKVVSAMATKAPNNTHKLLSLNWSILNIVRNMYPISADEILLEIEEDEDRKLSREELIERLGRMCKHHVLTKVTLPNDKVVYMVDRK
jgi:hypothetical protein